jgi:SNF2 family DNA or RNA helicase
VNNAQGKSFKTFQAETMVQVTNFKWVPKADGYETARRLLTPAIRIDISEVWDGPPMTTQQREVELTAEQKKLLAELKRSLQVTVKSGVAISSVNEASVRTKFLQVSLGAVYDQSHKAHAVDATHRIEELKAVIREAPGKMLIFAPFTSVINHLDKHLTDWTRAVVNGGTSAKERAKIFQAFQSEPEPRLIIADPGTMSHGLDLYAAQTVVFYGPTEKTEVYLQACKRAHRPGQKFPVVVVQLISNKLEAEIFKRLERNETLQGALLDAVKNGEI